MRGWKLERLLHVTSFRTYVATRAGGGCPGGSCDAHSQTTAPAAKPRATRGGRTKRGASRKPPYVLLPVLVVDETLLLPHMSIPFPIEDEEAAKVVERASRGEHRHVLVLTERPILPESEAELAQWRRGRGA